MIPTYPMENEYPIETTIDIRQATKEEIAEVFGEDIAKYTQHCTVLVLGDGSRLFPSQDEEGNGVGAFFGINAEGKQYIL